MNRLFLGGAVAVVLAALLAGFAVVGGPGHARAESRDQTRLADLRHLADALICETAEQAAFSRACRSTEQSLHDPLTGAAYEVARGAESLAVCATFEVPQEKTVASGRERLHFDGAVGCLRYRRVPSSRQWVVQAP